MGELDWADDDAPAAYREYAARLSPSWSQVLAIAALAAALVPALLIDAALTLTLSVFLVQLGFIAATIWRALLLAASATALSPCPDPEHLPRYTVLVALFQEANVVAQLVERLARIDYPADRLEGFIVLEADDHETRAAIDGLVLPSWLLVLAAPDGAPRTKPRALNIGLQRATGALLTVYDAEDDPDPLQLREAASRFAADEKAAIWALQAPLRIRTRRETNSAFLDRQFAIEYASLFEVTLPGLARLGLPFPMGGTSNHFRVAQLRAVGGWDNHNVTEDADLGFRIWRAGGKLDVITRPTHEPPPGGLDHWLPQRTRWLKGFMQTWGVHTRDPRGLGWRGNLSLIMTVGSAIASAALHALSISWLISTFLIAVAAGLRPDAPPFALSVFTTGVLAAWVTAAIGCSRAGRDYTVGDMAAAPAYWSLLSLAFVHAAWRLLWEPFVWDKTAHFADAPSPTAASTGREHG